MAQLKNLLVSGPSRFIGDIIGENFQITSLKIPTASNGTTFTTGTNGQILKTNGTSIYWAADNNTTYTFSGGTNSFTVTPSGGSAQKITITPSITNNITGTGASGYLVKFNGINTITNGPQLSSAISSQTQSTKFLREDGTWAAPTYNNYILPEATANTLGGVTIGDGITVNNGQISVTAANLGLSNALHFIGISTSDMTDGQTSTPTFSGISNYTPQPGDVVLAKNSASGSSNKKGEFIYIKIGNNTGWWELLGDEGSYKILQTAITKPTETTNKWISAIGQNANGNIDVSYASLNTSGTWTGTATNAEKFNVHLFNNTSGSITYYPAGPKNTSGYDSFNISKAISIYQYCNPQRQTYLNIGTPITGESAGYGFLKIQGGTTSIILKPSSNGTSSPIHTISKGSGDSWIAVGATTGVGGQVSGTTNYYPIYLNNLGELTQITGTLNNNVISSETAYINNNSNTYYLTGAENTTAGNKELKISPLLKYEASAEPIAHINSQNVEYSDITYKNVSLTIGSVEDNERSVSSLILTSYDHNDDISYTGLQHYGAIFIPNLQENGEYHLPDSLNGDSSINWIAIGNKRGVGGPEINSDDQIVGYWLMHLDDTGILTNSNTTLGSTVKPIYLFGGRLRAVDYELKATVNKGTQTNNVEDTQYLAYYADEHNINPAKERTSTSLISTIGYTENNTTHDVPEGLELINASVESSLKYSASNGLDSWKIGIKTGVSQDIENLTGQDLSSYNTNNANLINNSFGFYNCKNYGNNTDHSGLKAYFTETGHFIINNTNKEKSVGLSLWGERNVTGQGVATAPNYGIFIASPDFYGKFGDVQGDLTDTNNSKTMYFTMDNISNNGWLWKCNRNTNQTSMAASLSCRGVFTAKSFAKNDDYNHTFILIPDGGTRLLNSSSSSLSVLKITLPIGPSYRMFQFVIDIYGYNVGKVSYHIAAYTNNSGWSNVKAHSYGLGDNLNLPIKCGVDANNKLFVALGDNTTSWSYPIVAVRNIQAGTYETTTQEIACGWSMNFVSPSSIESLIQKTISDPALNRPNNFLDSSNNFSPRLAFYSDKNHLDPTEKIIYNNTTGVLQITNGTSDKMLQIDTTCAEASIRLTSNNGNNPPSGDWVIGVNPGGNIANPSEGNIALDEGSFGFYEQKNERLRAYFTKQGHFIINKNTYIQNQEFSTGISLWSEPSDLDVSSTNLTKSPIYGMYISYANIHGKFGDVSNNNHTMYFTLGTTSDPFNQGWIWKVGREIGQNYIAASLSKNGIFSAKGINLYSKDTASQNEINSKFGQIRIVNNLTSNKTYMVPINTSADNLWIAIGGHYDSTGSLCSGVGGSVTNNSINGYQLMHLNTSGILTASDTTLGSTTKAVYLNQGRLEPLSYKLEANINQGASGDTQYLAYYSAQHEINPTKNRTSKTLISANNVNQVLGLSTTNGECSISYNAGVSGNTSAGHWVVGINPGGAGANTFGFYEHLSNGGIGTLRASLNNAGVLSVENLITSRGFIRSDNRSDTLSTTSNQYNQTSDDGLFVMAPGRGFLHCRNGTQKGMIKITIPQVNQLTMLSFWVDIYNYNGEVTSYHIGGQKRTNQLTWEKCSAYSLGNGEFSNLTVRFVSTSGGSSIYNYAIYIGETTTKWEYCNIVVRDVNLGFQVGNDKTAWNDFIVSIESATLSTGSIKATITNPNVASPYNIKPYTYISTSSKSISTSWSDLVYYHANRGPSIPGLYLFTVQFTAPVTGSNGTTNVRFGWGGVIPWMSKNSSYGGYTSTLYPLNYPLGGTTNYTFGFGSNIFLLGAILQHDSYGTRIQIKHTSSGTITIPAGKLQLTWHYLTQPSAVA